MLYQSNQQFFPQGFDAHFYVEDLFPWDLLDSMQTAFQQLSGKILSPIPEGVHLENLESIHIEEGCLIEPGAFIRGPCFLARGVTVRHGAYLRGNVWVGKNSLLGHATELKNVLIGEHTSLAHFVYAADSIIGSHVNLASHVTLANLRLDEAKVQPMNRAKFGAVIGDYSKLGCHVVLNPGKQLLPHTKIYVQQQLITL
jgi:NDP-sugar pyrophosphorylase family protein